jgi:RES domain-containing protein
MIVYRIGKSKFSDDLTGEGAKRVGGRWNHPGVPCIYAGATKSLCLLEFSAHATLDTIPRALSFTTYEIPGRLIKEIKTGELPGNWSQWPHPKESRDFGTKLLNKNADLILQMPSAILNDEYIYVINPSHPKMKEVKIVAIKIMLMMCG